MVDIAVVGVGTPWSLRQQLPGAPWFPATVWGAVDGLAGIPPYGPAGRFHDGPAADGCDPLGLVAGQHIVLITSKSLGPAILIFA